MRFYVKVDGSDRSYVIPCNDAGATVSKLKEDILARMDVTRLPKCGYQLLLSSNGALVGDSDTVGDVLKDGDFLTLCK